MNFGSDIIKDITIGFLGTTLKDNSLLYEHATAELGDNVLRNSTILEVARSSEDGAKVLVKTPSGFVLIKAKKIIFTIPPNLANLPG